MTADPKIVPSAKTIPVVSYSEATEMAYFGAKVMHPKTLEPVSEKKILVRLKNVFNPKGPETIVVSEDKIIKKGIVKTVAMIKDVGLITISGAGMVGTPGIAAKVFEVLGREKINVLMISQSSSEVGISIIVPRNVLTKASNSLELSLLGSEIVNKITLEDKICIVAVIGSGMVGIPGIAAKVFKFIAEEGINIRMIAQGSSELNISFVINENEGIKAVQTLHDKFKLNE